MKYLEDVLPNENVSNISVPVFVVIVGTITKYVLGGYILDLIGHLLIFLGCMNIVNYFTRKYAQKLNNIVFIIILILLFIGAQMLSIQIFNNYLHIEPVFATN